MKKMKKSRVFQVGYLGIRFGGFNRRWQSGLSSKLIREKYLIKKHKKAPPFLKARAD
jgi:hypothetical protein